MKDESRSSGLCRAASLLKGLPMQYSDFAIRISPMEENRLLIRVDCDAGEASTEITPDLGPAVAKSLFGEFQAVVGRGTLSTEKRTVDRGVSSVEAPMPADLIELGRRLFAFLLPPDLRSLWTRTWGICTSRGDGLRLRLHLDLKRTDLAWIAALPWELLYDDDAGGFLALDGRTPVVRYLDVRRDRRTFPSARPWRVLVVMSNPEGSRRLDLGAERRQLQETWANPEEVQLVFPENASFDGIRRELTRGPIHGIHYMGHGVFDESTGRGGLLLEARSGGAVSLLGPAMKDLVKGVEPPALVVLNGCETGRVSSREGPEPFGAGAAALIDAGVPAVVAMQLPVADGEAVHFSKILYRALQDRHPIDWAVSEARLSLNAGFPERPAWAIPALFMRVPDGRLFKDPQGPVHGESESPLHKATTIADSLNGSTINTTGADISGGAAGQSGPSSAETRVKEAKNTNISTTGYRQS